MSAGGDTGGGKTGPGPDPDLAPANLLEIVGSDEVYRHAVELAGLIVWTADSTGRILSISHRFTEVTGLPADALGPAVHPDDRERVSEAWSRSIKAGKPLHVEFRMQTPGGDHRHYRALSGPRRDRDGRVVGWYGFTEDIHDRKVATLGLAEAEERYRLAIRATDDSIYDLDLVKHEIRWRDSGAESLGYPAQPQPTSLSWWEERIHPEDRDRLVEGLERIIASDRDRWSVEYRLRAANGDYVHLYDQALIVRDSDGIARRAIGAIRDVSKQRKAEADLLRLQSELVHVSRRNAMGSMASTLAHELNQPLTAATNFINGARRIAARSGESNPLIEALDAAGSSTIRAGQIVRRLRELIIRGATSAGPAHLPSLIQEANVLAFVDAGLQGVRQMIELDRSAQWVWVDKVQIQQVLINLIRNAIEAMEESPKREVRISTNRIAGDLVEVKIADTGTGFDPARSANLFSQFFTTKREGMGIGLPISRTIIEAHGGQIRAANRPEGGAIFSFTLPSTPEPQNGATSSAPRNA